MGGVGGTGGCLRAGEVSPGEGKNTCTGKVSGV